MFHRVIHETKLEGLSPAWFCPVSGHGLQGIVGPVMSGVAAPEVLADFEIGVLPEIRQVPGDLHGP